MSQCVSAGFKKSLGRRLDLKKVLNFDSGSIDYVLPGLPRGCVGGLVGPGGVGKSTFALRIAAEICTGPFWDYLIPGMPQVVGDVLYVSVEDPEFIIQQRIDVLMEDLPIEQQDELFERLRVWIPSPGFDICQKEFFQSIVEQAKGVRLIVVDPLSRMHKANENCNRQMSDVMECLSTLAIEAEAAVLFIHHTMKLIGDEVAAQYVSRGAGCISDSSRWLAALSREARRGGRASGNGDLVHLELVKSNYFESKISRSFSRTSSGFIQPQDSISSRESVGSGGKGVYIAHRSMLDGR